MFCQNCGKELPNTARFCPACGTAMQVAAPVSPVTPIAPAEEVIDLTGTVDLSAPQEGRCKSLVAASVLTSVFWIIYALALKPWAEFTGMDGGVEFGLYLLSAAFVTVPIGIIGLICTLISKKKARLAVKIRKSESFVFYILSWIISSCAIASGYAICFEGNSLGNAVGWICTALTAVFTISFMILGISVSIQQGKEGTYALLTAFFSSFIPALVIGYALAALITAYIIFVSVIVILLVVIFGSFFANGGKIVYKYQ